MISEDASCCGFCCQTGFGGLIPANYVKCFLPQSHNMNTSLIRDLHLFLGTSKIVMTGDKFMVYSSLPPSSYWERPTRLELSVCACLMDPSPWLQRCKE